MMATLPKFEYQAMSLLVARCNRNDTLHPQESAP